VRDFGWLREPVASEQSTCTRGIINFATFITYVWFT
jgi:hypothetical protein